MCRRFIASLLVFGLFQTAFAFEDELRFVEALTAEGFPDLAQTVLNRTLTRFPEAEKSATELRIRILIAEKKFEEAAQQIRAWETVSIGTPQTPILNRQSLISNFPCLWLFLAETAYRAGQVSAAESAYKNFFTAEVQTNDAVFQAAFNYGRLLEDRDALKSARTLYEQILKNPTSARAARPVKLKLAKLLIEENPDRAKKLCEEVQLGGLDLWFGEAVVIWADIMIRTNEWSETQSVLETQLETLKKISESVNSSVSPIAGARYLLGTCYEHADKKAEALTQFYNVYAQYGDSEWGPRAQERAQALIAFFEGQGKTVKIEIGPHRAKIEESAFRVARRLFFEKQYAAAVPAYLDALNKFPEVDESVTALRDLTLSSIYLDDPLTAKTVSSYIGERFAKRDSAADALLAAGKCALDEKQTALADWIYDRYFESFPRHTRAPGVLYSLATLKTGAKQDAALKRVLENYPDSPYALRALGRLAWNAFEKEEYSAAAPRFETFLITETDPEKQTRARFALAESYRLSGDWKNAFKNFQTLETSLNQAEGQFGISEEARTFNRPFIEKSLFYQGVCLAKLGEKETAVQTFDHFIERFQGSEFIPQAQIAKGSVLLDLKRFDDALAALAAFNESGDRTFLEPALYYRGQAFFETGRHSESIQTLEKLLTAWPESAFFFEAKLLQGRAYAAAGQNTDAVRVLSDVLNLSGAALKLIRRKSSPRSSASRCLPIRPFRNRPR
ncbi:MAG: tetratricopeptide repeat protein [Pontiellaceae bacterium]|nr:tetratricopeptide repeat protein [Pontiellaceae bacterium]